MTGTVSTFDLGSSSFLSNSIDYDDFLSPLTEKKYVREWDIRDEVSYDPMQTNQIYCNVSITDVDSSNKPLSKPEVELHLGLGNIDPIAKVHSDVKFVLNTPAYRSMMNFIRDEAENVPMGEEDLDMYREYCNPVFSSAGSLHYNSTVNNTMKDDCRKIHAYHIHALIKENEEQKILIVGDRLGRCANFFSDKLPSSLAILTDAPHSEYPNVSLDYVRDNISLFGTYYLMYEAEVSLSVLSVIRDLFGKKVSVECYIDWHGLRNDKSMLTGVDPPYIDKDGNYMFMACTGGKPFPSVNYSSVEGFMKMDCSQFHQIYHIKHAKSAVRRLFHFWVRNVKNYPDHEFKYNSGLPLTDQDLSMLYSKQFVVSEKNDGKLGKLVIHHGRYRVTSFDQVSVLREGIWPDEQDRAIMQLELMPDGRHIVTDVFSAVSRIKNYSGGFIFRYQYATDRRRWLSCIRIFPKPWYGPHQIQDVYDNSKEGIVFQRLVAPPGRPSSIGSGEKYGTARYIKKNWTIDKYFDDPAQVGASYVGPGVYEVVASEYDKGIIDVIRFRHDKSEPNTPAQEYLIGQAYTVDKAKVVYPRLGKPCLITNNVRTVVLSEKPIRRQKNMTISEWRAKFIKKGFNMPRE